MTLLLIFPESNRIPSLWPFDASPVPDNQVSSIDKAIEPTQTAQRPSDWHPLDMDPMQKCRIDV